MCGHGSVRPADVDANLTTATDLAYQTVVKSDRTGPYIMCKLRHSSVRAAEPDYVKLYRRGSSKISGQATQTGLSSAILCGVTDGCKPSRTSART